MGARYWMLAAVSLVIACDNTPRTAQLHTGQGMKYSFPCNEAPQFDPADPLLASVLAEYSTRLVENDASFDADMSSQDRLDYIVDFVCREGQPPDRTAVFPETGADTPSFTLYPIAGSAAVDTLRGGSSDSPTLLLFWGSWCIPCRREFPTLVQEIPRWQAAGVNVALVIHNEPEDHAAFWVGQGTDLAKVPLYSDPGHEVASDFMVRGIPWIYALDAEGRVLLQCRGCSVDRLDRDLLLRVLTGEIPPPKDFVEAAHVAVRR